jgi:diacylglycerol kinase family enzyme
MKAIVIYNPISGKGAGEYVANVISKSELNKKFELTFSQTNYNGHAKEIAKMALENGIRYIIAVGGDGTINEIGSVLKNTNAVMGIIPIGSGNGLAKHLGMSTRIETAINQLADAKESKIDTLTINNRFAINVSGFGFDGYVAYRFNHHGKRGISTYTKIGLTEYFKYPIQEFQLTIDDKTTIVKKHMLVIANASQFGNSAIIAPSADITDGRLELVAVELPPVLHLAGILLKLFSGKLKDNRFIQTYLQKGFHNPEV